MASSAKPRDDARVAATTMQPTPEPDLGVAPRPGAGASADSRWAKSFANDVKALRSDVSYKDSAAFLRALTRKRALSFFDIRDDPGRFFLAHRLLAEHAPEHGPGFWIRFTVQFNLFAGTVVALGGPAQLEALDVIQRKGQLGCFCLTEVLAGVNSGLVVNTTATWDARSKCFIINSPTEGAVKNWISQGLTAHKAVVIADLTVSGKRVGPHGFLIDMTHKGIVTGDMGKKTTGVDLDNAWVKFDNVKVPKQSLLNRYGDVIDDEYVPAVKGVRTMDMIGQRLFTGRVAVAQAALIFAAKLFADTRRYSDAKPCTMRNGVRPELSQVPQLAALYDEADARLSATRDFVDACEAELRRSLVKNETPGSALTRAIAVAKIRAVETSIELCHRLKQEVGSFALMDGTGFEHADFLQCCKFAEGDSRILSQKLARDAFAEYARAKKKSANATPSGWSKWEIELCDRVALFIDSGGGNRAAAWDAAWREVYALAAAVCDRVMDEWGGGAPARAKL